MNIRTISRSEMTLATRGRKAMKVNVNRYAQVEQVINGELPEARIYFMKKSALTSFRVATYRKYGASAVKTSASKAKQPGFYLTVTKG
jgi:hypothetical protein